MQKLIWCLATSAVVAIVTLLAASPAGAYVGDTECLSCHGEGTLFSEEYNKSSYLMTGHRNMLRKVTAGSVLKGSDGAAYTTGKDGLTYATGMIDWDLPGFTLSATTYDLFYIFGGWMAKEPYIVRQGGQYTCGECHTTGWDSSGLGAEPPQEVRDGLGANLLGSWELEGVQCERCHGEAGDAPQYGQPRHDASRLAFIADSESGEPKKPQSSAATALCMECHTQDLQAYPGVAIGKHGDFAEDFDGHSHGSEFLNSPHARFAGLPAGISDSSLYRSLFGGADDGGGVLNYGCTGCHNVHQSTVDATGHSQYNQYADGVLVAMGAIRRSCAMECHSNTSPDGPKDSQGNPIGYRGFHDGLGGISPDTLGGANPEACITCHMTKKFASHLFRINTDPDYSPFKTVAEFETEGECHDEAGNPLSFVTKTDCTAGDGHWLVLADTYQEELDGRVFPAVALSVTEACLQCHDGSQSYVVELDKKTIAQYAAGYHFGTPLATSHTLGYHADFGPNAPQVCNDCHGYFDSADEVPYVDACLRCHGPGMIASRSTPMTAYEAEIIGYDYHGGSAAPNPDATALLSWSFGPCFTVNLDASGNAAMVAGWELPGSVSDSCDADSTTCIVIYGAAGSYDVTVHLADDTYKTVVVKAVDTGMPPTAAMSVANTGAAGGMTVELTDNGSASQACGADQSLTGTVLWGDGASSTIDLATATVTPPHTYPIQGAYTIQYSVVDAAGRKTDAGPVRVTVPEVSGSTTFNIAGTTVARATVYLQKNGSTVKYVKTLTGDFAFTDVVNDSYTVKAVKYGTTYGPRSVSNTDDGTMNDDDYDPVTNPAPDGTVTVNLQ